MQLSLREAAQVLGCSDRQIRYRIKQGRLKASKQGGQWSIASEDLPLSDAERRNLGARAQAVREVLKEALEAPAATAEKTAKRRFSVRDLRAFQVGEKLHREAVHQLGAGDPATLRLAEALELLCQGCHAFRRGDKASLYETARTRAASAVAALLLGGAADDPARADLADRLEQSFLADLSGLIRVTERAATRDRFDSFGGRRPR